jgi:hypothetical protein
MNAIGRLMRLAVDVVVVVIGVQAVVAIGYAVKLLAIG